MPRAAHTSYALVAAGDDEVHLVGDGGIAQQSQDRAVARLLLIVIEPLAARSLRSENFPSASSAPLF